MDIEGNLDVYLAGLGPDGRYASFDYCFNHFQDHRVGGRLEALADGDCLQVSCLHLGFYLASWGMLRGSSSLLQRSVLQFAPLIEVIVEAEPAVWSIDAHRYTRDEWSLLNDIRGRVRTALAPHQASDILVTKILLGVFGCVPAFDTYFRRGMGVTSFGPKALSVIEDFYRRNEETVERHRRRTLTFPTGEESSHRYTRAKVIDMVFFVEGARRP
jgi:hypothetical protein